MVMKCRPRMRDAHIVCANESCKFEIQEHVLSVVFLVLGSGRVQLFLADQCSRRASSLWNAKSLDYPTRPSPLLLLLLLMVMSIPLLLWLFLSLSVPSLSLSYRRTTRKTGEGASPRGAEGVEGSSQTSHRDELGGSSLERARARRGRKY